MADTKLTVRLSLTFDITARDGDRDEAVYELVSELRKVPLIEMGGTIDITDVQEHKPN